MVRRIDPNTWFQQALKVTEDRAASEWLKQSLVAAINRDPVDAAKDVDILCVILRGRAAAARRNPQSNSPRESNKQLS